MEKSFTYHIIESADGEVQMNKSAFSLHCATING